MSIDVDRWMLAEDETAQRRYRVQVFLYRESGQGKDHRRDGLHVVRDLSLPAPQQVVWQQWADEAGYAQAFERAQVAQRRYCIQMIAGRYDPLSAAAVK